MTVPHVPTPQRAPMSKGIHQRDLLKCLALTPATLPTAPVGAIRQGDWKLIEFFEDGRSELYNLAEDIGEQPNLAAAMPRRTNELHQMARAWRESLHAPVPTKRDPKYSPDPETGNSQARRVAQNKDE